MPTASAHPNHDYYARRAERACWNLPNEREKSVVHVADQARDLVQQPSSGRNTRLGKKVEKPRDPKSGGPSGQKDRARHDKRHANK